MATATKTLKLPFLGLNQSKRDEFVSMQAINTEVANKIVEMPKAERRNLTTKSFVDIPIGSAWMNQTIRNANAKTKVNQFKVLPLETNNQNWTMHKVGNTYSVSFGLVRGVKKRIPIEVHQASHIAWIDALIENKAKAGSIKLYKSRKNIWYACISVSMDVPDAEETGNWIGVDRGQNIPAVAALPNGRGVFFKANRIKHIRKQYQLRRKKLQKAGKHRAVKKLESRERRIVTHINHCISKQIVSLAKRNSCGIRMEDLSGIRQTIKQRKKTKSDATKNRDFWPFYQLELFTKYKAQLDVVAFEKIPAPYTSKTHFDCGHIGVRNGFDFYCSHCNKHEHADLNAGRNIGGWSGMFCAVDPSKWLPVISNHGLPHAVYDSPPNYVSETNPQGLA